MNNTTVINHPLIQNKLTKARNRMTDSKMFRETINEIAGLMCYEATKDLKTVPMNIETPLAKTQGEVLSDGIVIVPIMRAGLGMVDAMHMLIPHAKIGHIGLYRDETSFTPEKYYTKLPKDLENSTVLLLDPMLATGGSVRRSYEILKEAGAKDIRFIGIVAAPEGIKAIEDHCPDMRLYLAAIDEGLNDSKFITPGLGDAGDRLYGTK